MAGVVVLSRWGRRIGPWLTLVLVAVEAVLVWAGVVSVRDAVLVVVGVELLLAAVVGSRVIVAVRRFRAGCREHADIWSAAETGLAELVPRRLARVLVLEPRLWACLGRWVAGRYEKGYTYHGGVRVLVWVGVGLLILEGTVLDVVLALVIPGSPWVWVAAGLHVYGLVLVLGFYASLITRPHLLGSEVLLLRESVLVEVRVPYTAIREVRTGSYPDYARSWFKVHSERGVATIAYGDANVAISLDPAQPLLVNGAPCRTPVRTLYATADDPRAFVAAVQASLVVGGTPVPGNRRPSHDHGSPTPPR